MKYLFFTLIFGLFATAAVDLAVGPGDLRFFFVAATALLFLICTITLVIQRGLVKYVLKRLGQSAIVLWVVVSITFLLLRFIPGGPFDQEKALAPEVRAALEMKYGFQNPLSTQYLQYLKGVVSGDLGESMKYTGRTVTSILSENWPQSIQLGLYSLFLAYLIGVPLGVIAASRRDTWIDRASIAFAVSGVASPSFLVAPILVLIFCYGLNWLPPALWEGPSSYILPVITLGVRPAALLARLTRSSVLDVIHADFIRTARAKGLSEKQVLFKHVLKNSLLPLLTVSGPLVAGLMSGSFVVEVLFAIPGLGKHFVQSVSNRDYPLILGVTLAYASLLLFMNLLVDIYYVVVDPRIKLK